MDWILLWRWSDSALLCWLLEHPVDCPSFDHNKKLSVQLPLTSGNCWLHNFFGISTVFMLFLCLLNQVSQSYNSNIRRYDIHHFCVRQGRMSNNEIVFVLIEDKNFCLTSSYITIEYTQNLWIFSSLKNISKRKYKEIILMARRHRVFQLMHSWTTINNNSKHWRKEKQ